MISSLVAKVYAQLPTPAKNLAATLRGAYLQSWRYSRHTDALIQEYLARERWTADQLLEYREARLSQLLQHAALHIPHYRDWWRNCSDQSSTQFSNWPLLEKETLRASPLDLVAAGTNLRQLFRERTSGTTGTPVSVWWPKKTVEHVYACYNARTRYWHGVSRHERWAILGGQLIVPASRRKPPYWIHNYAGRQLYMSTHHLSPDTASDYAKALQSFQPSHLVAYPSTATLLARAFADQKLRPPQSLRVLISNAEQLTADQRETLSDVFQCPVRNTYGMSEIGPVASECEFGTMHIWADIAAMEVVGDNNDDPLLPPQVGRLVVTSLLNSAMPLVRYVTGDRGAIAVSGDCACGRTLPVLAKLEGRTSDMLISTDGRQVFWLNPVLYGLPIREGQLIQHEIDRLECLYVPAAGFQPDHERLIAVRLRDRLGPIKVDFVPMNHIPRNPNGKFQAVVCRLKE